MFWNAAQGRVPLDDAVIDYVTFGRGREVLLLLPGLGDGLTTVRGMALPLAAAYRLYAPYYKVYLFSRREPLPAGFTTRDMARDLARTIERLGIRQVHVVGISQGGLIAQYLAIDYPALVQKLVLAVTLARPNETVRPVVERWLRLAEQGAHRALLIDTAERSYSEKRLKKYRLLYPLLGWAGRPKSYERFKIQALSCLTHDAYGALGRIACPTLVVGGTEDAIVGAAASAELAAQIPHSQLYLCPGLGHAAYEEDPDFDRRILTFLQAPAESPQKPPV